ncbi:hypothetical protein GCM10007897_24170 [Sphingobium jiangsuense]|uniref:Uncharacterized protein n=1 Tax=Sphingobium jiangsuense TaxID=870476 RepID=A0A7W6BKJ8_9SPHN|nr:hypothetical protein [Sphingobium jiangsuense]MBB3928608.1 hypothetical protein [Sphingobium jiangsuense]GLT01026.1 hypothetical protein GCM10007897_24170 [Sphingobium jiangsuense]
MQTARHIHETAVLGSLIRYSNGQPRPPERFKRKLRDWEGENGTGRLVEREPASGSLAASFTLRLGEFGGAVIVAVFNRTFSAQSDMAFDILEVPTPGMVRVVTGHNGREVLHHLAPDMAAAERWMATNRFGDMRVEVVPCPDPVAIPQDMGKAA